MTEELDLYGPPGTGKTTSLTRIALQATEQFGPHALGAVTYTRAAALELRGRLAASLGIHVPESPRAAAKVLEQNIPWVGTIHSLCYRLIGRPPMVSGPDLKAFALSIDPRSRAEFNVARSADDVEGYEYGDIASRDEIELALQLHAMARHRMISLPEAGRYLNDRARMEINPYRMATFVKRYEEYKHETGKIDFEDMLELGREVPLPITVLLCDEVQDNSALLWSVIDSWQREAKLSVMAGDPWQAIYQYSGALPGLFRNRRGTWRTIGNSHRLSAQTAEFALSLLRTAGYQDDSLLSTWHGVGGKPKDNTTFYLARTNALTRSIRESLETKGTPYRLLRGTGPLSTNAAKAYRSILKDQDAGIVTVSTANLIAQSIPPKSGALPHGMKAALERLAREDGDALLSAEDREHIEAALPYLPYLDYFKRIVREYGMSGLILHPLVAVGTIHAAKGREADVVHLVRSWGTLPGRHIYEGGRQEEACVAYVGSTRHRTKLSFINGLEGIDYPFPPTMTETHPYGPDYEIDEKDIDVPENDRRYNA